MLVRDTSKYILLSSLARNRTLSRHKILSAYAITSKSRVFGAPLSLYQCTNQAACCRSKWLHARSDHYLILDNSTFFVNGRSIHFMASQHAR